MFVSLANLALSLPRTLKRSIAVSVDLFLCWLATSFSYFLRLDQFVPIDHDFLVPFGASVVFSIPIFLVLGLYREIFRFSGWSIVSTIFYAVLIYSIPFILIFTIHGMDRVPRTLGVIQPIILLLLIVGSRLSVSIWLGATYKNRIHGRPIQRVAIYGAGAAGRELASAILNAKRMSVAFYVDDDLQLNGLRLGGIPVYAASQLPDLVVSQRVATVLLAIPSASRSQKLALLEKVSKMNVEVKTLPTTMDLIDGRVSITDLRELDVDDLLGRETIEPDRKLLEKKVTDKTVLITGAGGSVGGEICRQILKLKPRVMVLVEISEFALYQIDRELRGSIADSLSQDSLEIIPLLCSVQDRTRINKIFRAWQPDTVYHAAAYKHVSLVEENCVSGIKNNLFGTLIAAEIAVESGVADFVLVSTDKAVRPTNIMGATKRLSEMVLQALQARDGNTTRFSMVRFGNVLASSGSVIPKFREQIQKGLPVTVTHTEVTRYFMTLTEAAQLVIQASALAEGGDVFLLDMGQPVKIIDLAKRIIQVSGFREKTSAFPNGDIEIQITGLRPGEKLFEELLIGDNPIMTSHPKIFRANEGFLCWQELTSCIKSIEQMAASNDIEGIVKQLREVVSGFEPSKDPTDLIYCANRGVTQT